MPIATIEPEVKKAPTKQQIEDLKDAIRELYHDYQTRRLELGMRLLQLQDMLADHDKGTFGTVATQELGIPRATVYDFINLAKSEIQRVQFELSESRTTDDDTVMDVDFSGPGLAKFLRIAYPNGVPKLKPRDPNPYVRPNYMQFVFTRLTRIEVVSS